MGEWDALRVFRRRKSGVADMAFAPKLRAWDWYCYVPVLNLTALGVLEDTAS